MRRWLLVLTALSLLVAGQASASARAPEERVGERLNILLAWHADPENPVAEFPADTPFHVWHAGCGNPGENHGPSQFLLEIDGVFQGYGSGPEGGDRPFVYEDENGDRAFCIQFETLYNYPEGFPAGEYAFTGIWIYGAPPNARQEPDLDVDSVLTVMVTFTP